MPYIRFLRDYTVKDETGTTYKAGQVVECREDVARHFTRRLAAELCDPPVVETVKAKSPQQRKDKQDGAAD